MMKKKLLSLICLFLLVAVSVSAEPVILNADRSGEFSVPYRQEDPDSASFVFSYRYPCVSDEDPCAEVINGYYGYQIDNALDFEIPMLADYYAASNTDLFRKVSYQLTCNNGCWFSVLICTEESNHLSFCGNTFSRDHTKNDSTVSLPYLLGILDSDENDVWLQDRQTEKADRLIRSLVWDVISCHSDSTSFYPDLNKEYLEEIFYPEDDFYLNEEGVPVFYLQPGDVAPEEYGLLTFPIPIDTILDEM